MGEVSGDLTDKSALRQQFSEALSARYTAEIPEYGILLALVERENAALMRQHEDPRGNDPAEVTAVSAQRHGAIRVGSATELALLRRLFALYGMEPVDFYDLVPAGLPVFSTAFRPVDPQALQMSPFRVFCSLLRTELIEPAAVRESVSCSLQERSIFSAELVRLVERAESHGGVSADEADKLVSLTLDVFQWSGEAQVDRLTYEQYLSAHKLIADIAAFKGPHINHLTPSALDIDRVHAQIAPAGLSAKAVIEGPPKRRCPILLRQTAFNAVSEPVLFVGSSQDGVHTARFGEVEQRGAALTPSGRARYDDCLALATKRSQSEGIAYDVALADAFAGFPDDWLKLLEQDLVYFRFSLVAGVQTCRLVDLDVDNHASLVAAVGEGLLHAEPIRYEDFLPVSAAGIFRSNLGGEQDGSWSAPSSRDAFERALGRPVLNSHVLYRQQQERSLAAIRSALPSSR